MQALPTAAAAHHLHHIITRTAGAIAIRLGRCRITNIAMSLNIRNFWINYEYTKGPYICGQSGIVRSNGGRAQKDTGNQILLATRNYILESSTVSILLRST